MEFVMRAEKRDKFLNDMLCEGESYKGKVWITIMASTAKLLKYAAIYGGAGGALSNTYGYMGLTDGALNFVTVGNVNVDSVKDRFCIPLNSITGIKIRRGYFGGRLLYLYFENESMKISIMNNALFSNIKDQRENADRLLAALQTRFQ